MKNYWRIPIYFNSKDFKLRAKIVVGKNIAESQKENKKKEDSPNNEKKEEKDDEVDFDFKSYAEKRRRELNEIVYTKSDNKDESRESPSSKKKVRSPFRIKSKRTKDN